MPSVFGLPLYFYNSEIDISVRTIGSPAHNLSRQVYGGDPDRPEPRSRTDAHVSEAYRWQTPAAPSGTCGCNPDWSRNCGSSSQSKQHNRSEDWGQPLGLFSLSFFSFPVSGSTSTSSNFFALMLYFSSWSTCSPNRSTTRLRYSLKLLSIAA